MKKFQNIALWSAVSIAGGFIGWRLASKAGTLRSRNLAKGKSIVILGAGFGGREAARELARLLPGRDNGQITLVDQRPYLLFTPMLTEAAGGDVEPWHITSSVDLLPSRVRFVQGTIESLELGTRSVALQNQNALQADQLLIALGSASNFHHAKGVEEVAFTMKSLEDAEAVCRHALQRVSEAEQEQDPGRRKSLLTFVVAGGGYTGVETMAALNDLVRDEVKRRPALNPAEIRMMIVEPLERIMLEVTPDLADYAQQQLEARGVEIALRVGIREATPDMIRLEDGREIRSGTLIWTAGVMPSSVVQKVDGPKGRQHGLKVEATLAVPGKPGVWAVGDCAEIPQEGSGGKNYTPTAQNATREGVHVARNIVRSLRGEPLKPFRYTQIGELALVGRRRGVARIYGWNFSGFIAWAMWRAIYLSKMPGILQRLRIASDWFMSCFIKSHPAALRLPEAAANAADGREQFLAG